MQIFSVFGCSAPSGVVCGPTEKHLMGGLTVLKTEYGGIVQMICTLCLNEILKNAAGEENEE